MLVPHRLQMNVGGEMKEIGIREYWSTSHILLEETRIVKQLGKVAAGETILLLIRCGNDNKKEISCPQRINLSHLWPHRISLAKWWWDRIDISSISSSSTRKLWRNGRNVER